MNGNRLALARTASAVAVTATVLCCGASGSTAVPIQVTKTAGEPDLVEDFSTYRSTADLLSDPRGLYARSEDFYDNSSIGGPARNNGAGTLELDQTDGYGGRSQCMKYTWFSFPSPGGGGSLGRILAWPQGAQDEVWVEVVVKFSPNFEIANGFSGGVAYKFQFGMAPMIGHGYTLEFVGGGGGLQLYYSDGSGGESSSYVNTSASLGDFLDDQWHTVRVHVDRNAPLFRVWLDDTLLTTIRDFRASNGYWGQRLGANINMRPVNNVQTLKYGLIRVWYAGNDPGW